MTFSTNHPILFLLVGIWLVPVIGKKLLGGMSNLEAKDKKWSEIFQNAMFIGMISAFLGFVFCDAGMLWNPVAGITPTVGLIPVCVMGVPALNAGAVGIMVPVSVLFTIAVSRILYKKGVL